MPKGQPNKRYTAGIQNQSSGNNAQRKVSYRETARQFDIPNSRVTAWERPYLEEEQEDLRRTQRKRKTTGRSPKIKKEVEEDSDCRSTAPSCGECVLKNTNTWLLRGYGKRKSTSDMGTEA